MGLHAILIMWVSAVLLVSGEADEIVAFIEDTDVHETGEMDEDTEEDEVYHYADLWIDETDCPPVHAQLLPSKQDEVLWGTPYRAHLTIPDEVELTVSDIPEAGHGIRATTFIKSYTWLDEYDGEVVHDCGEISAYAWKISRSGKVLHYIDGVDLATSNWLRWINCARSPTEENVGVLECRGQIFYMSWRDIYPGEELLVYYGDDYAGDLGIKPWGHG